MQYVSTRGNSPAVGFSAALQRGLAPDGGLYVPDAWPSFDPATLPPSDPLPPLAAAFIAPFAAGDVLQAQLPAILAEAFNFPAPLRPVPGNDSGNERLYVLELVHGPTAAFKDFGARFLAASLAKLRPPGSRPLRIIVATSGDTGGAVAAAFHRRPGFEVVVLYPKGLVSPTQERQLTCWGGNVRSFAVLGTFDDCQRMAKEALADAELRASSELSSANSINLGRLLPQASYYAAASLEIWRKHGQRASFIIPSGNLGNSVACVWARKVGLPIDEILLAHNVNRTVPEYLETGQLRTRPSVATLASAMDVGAPSNLERLAFLHPDIDDLRHAVSATSVTDEEISARIRTEHAAHGLVWCPHTAVAAEAYRKLPQERRDKHWVIVGTAHAAKFREIVEPLIGRRLGMPSALQALFDRPSQFEEIPASLEALRAALQASGTHG